MLGTRFPLASGLPGPGPRSSRDGSPRAHTTRSGPFVDIRHSDEISGKSSHEDGHLPSPAGVRSLRRTPSMVSGPGAGWAAPSARRRTPDPGANPVALLNGPVRPPDGSMAYEQGVFGKRVALPGVSISLPNRR